ncbi:MAG: hypothetical protein WC624_05240 [Candidatus Margulisiibacteriota bacterium]
MKKTLFSFVLSILLLPIISASANANVSSDFQFFHQGTTNTTNNKQISIYAQKSAQEVYGSINEIYIIKLSQTTNSSGKATYSYDPPYIPIYASGLDVSTDVIKQYIWVDSHHPAAIPPARKAVKIVNFQANQLNKVYFPSTAAPPSGTPAQKIRAKVRQLSPKPK